MKKIPKILLIVGAISLALSIVFWQSYSMLTDKALYEIDECFTTFNGRINEDPLTTTEQETLSRSDTLREVNPDLHNQIIDECTSKNPQAGRDLLYRGAFILIPVALFLLPIGGIWAIVDIVRRKGKPEKK
ncbi:MAG TPA: hypothetical protein VE573_17155 [Nitrososphaeraceae archaeon]|jgi:hypothetical protein|nr:hypothetical protein [Nitrososphaeraceae archaeon]